jgi:hypothetical protein
LLPRQAPPARNDSLVKQIFDNRYSQLN